MSEKIDRKIIGIEYCEFGTAIQQGRQPEVDADQGARSVGPGLCFYGIASSRARGHRRRSLRRPAHRLPTRNQRQPRALTQELHYAGHSLPQLQ